MAKKEKATVCFYNVRLAYPSLSAPRLRKNDNTKEEWEAYEVSFWAEKDTYIHADGVPLLGEVVGKPGEAYDDMEDILYHFAKGSGFGEKIIKKASVIENGEACVKPYDYVSGEKDNHFSEWESFTEDDFRAQVSSRLQYDDDGEVKPFCVPTLYDEYGNQLTTKRDIDAMGTLLSGGALANVFVQMVTRTGTDNPGISIYLKAVQLVEPAKGSDPRYPDFGGGIKSTMLTKKEGGQSALRTAGGNIAGGRRGSDDDGSDDDGSDDDGGRRGGGRRGGDDGGRRGGGRR